MKNHKKTKGKTVHKTKAGELIKTKDWQKAMRKHIKKLDQSERYDFAHAMLFDIALWASYNTYESIGLLEVVKSDLFASSCQANNED